MMDIMLRTSLLPKTKSKSNIPEFSYTYTLYIYMIHCYIDTYTNILFEIAQMEGLIRSVISFKGFPRQ